MAGQAQPSDPDYEASVARAESEYAAGHFEQALASFAKAQELLPGAGALRSMAMAECELRRYAACVAHLQAALQSQVHPLEGEQRARAEVLLHKTKAFVSRVTLQVIPGTVPVSVLVDGVATDLAPDGSVILQVGEHNVEVRAEGFEAARRKVVLQGGDDEELLIALPIKSLAKAAGAPPVAAQPKLPPAYTQVDRTDAADGGSVWASPWLWVGACVLVAGTAAAVVVLGAQDQDPRVAGPPTTPNTPPGLVLMALH